MLTEKPPQLRHELRRNTTQAFLDAALSNVGDGRGDNAVMSKEELLAALKEEVDLENRPHPGDEID